MAIVCPEAVEVPVGAKDRSCSLAGSTNAPGTIFVEPIAPLPATGAAENACN